MAFCTCYSDRISKEHKHEFDEYMVCISGQCTVTMNGKEFVLNTFNIILEHSQIFKKYK